MLHKGHIALFRIALFKDSPSDGGELLLVRHVGNTSSLAQDVRLDEDGEACCVAAFGGDFCGAIWVWVEVVSAKQMPVSIREEECPDTSMFGLEFSVDPQGRGWSWRFIERQAGGVSSQGVGQGAKDILQSFPAPEPMLCANAVYQ